MNTNTYLKIAKTEQRQGLTGSEIMDRIKVRKDIFVANGSKNEQAGSLSKEAVNALHETGVIRMLMPGTYGGVEAHPLQYIDAILELGALDAATGWVAGVVGIHPHELAQAEDLLQEEIWGKSAETWIASPYAPMGVARPVDGGFVLNGHWKFSSGTDHCDWVVIGGFVTNPDGTPNTKDHRHFYLPRTDYEIVEDSWNTLGLRGTGSKDLIVKNAFVPGHRVLEIGDLLDGVAGRKRGLMNPLYSLPQGTMFSAAITAATLAIAKGAAKSALELLTRSSPQEAGRFAGNPYLLQAVGEATADIDASICHVRDGISRAYDLASRSAEVPLSVRFELRRNQTTATHRALAAVDRLMLHSGGRSIHLDQPLQRAWRDMHAAMHHIINISEPWQRDWALHNIDPNLALAAKP